ncbi:MAG TPA: urease accessory protein UreD [Trebonia sp.]|nr:urease accessory protein UreD [Trebonia sp.]
MTVRPALNRVRATAWITAEAGGGLARLRSQAPLVLRPARDAVYLVGAAGGPVGGDLLDLRIEVRAGAALRLRTVAASVALPGLDGSESVLTVTATVAKGGVLEYLPEPVVVADGARHTTDIQVDLAPGAALVLRDETILGRHGERGGACRTRLRVDYDGRPLLRHEVAADGSDEVGLGPAVLAGHRAYGTLLYAGEFAVGPRPPGPTATSRARPDVAVMPLAGPGVLVTALAADSLALRRLLDGMA